MQYLNVLIVFGSIAVCAANAAVNQAPLEQRRKLYDLSSVYLPSTSSYGTADYGTSYVTGGGYPTGSVYSTGNSGGLLSSLPIVGDVFGASGGLLPGGLLSGGLLSNGLLSDGLLSVPSTLLSVPTSLLSSTLNGGLASGVLGNFGGIGATLPIIGDQQLGLGNLLNLGGGILSPVTNIIEAPLQLLGFQASSNARRLQEDPLDKVTDVATALQGILESVKADPNMSQLYQEMLDALIAASQKAKAALEAEQTTKDVEASPETPQLPQIPFLENTVKAYQDFVDAITSEGTVSKASQFLQDMYDGARTAIATDRAKQEIQAVADQLTSFFRQAVPSDVDLDSLLKDSVSSARNFFESIFS